MRFRYFAYGSNMLTTRLRPRCPGAMVLGRAVAEGYVLEFSKPSIDGSGKATLREAVARWASGVLFEIPKAELGALDAHEGLGNGYDRNDAFPVRFIGSGKIVQASTYLATSRDSSLLPYDWYLALVIAGAREHGLENDYVAMLRAVACGSDPNSNRGTRAVALEALMAVGFEDYTALLVDT